jgi:single-strand DNA-binding protein
MRKGLPQISGRGFLISKGVELAYSNAGVAYARLPLSFAHRVKDGDSDEWVTKNDILIHGVAFGELAEYLAQAVPDGQHAEIDVVGEVYFETYENKDGEEVPQVKMTVSAAGVVEERQSGRRSSGGGGRKPTGSKKKQDKPADDPWASYSPSEPPEDPWANDEPPF